MSTAKGKAVGLQGPDRPNASPSRTVGMGLDEEARLNVTLPVSIHQKVKMRATENRQSIRQYILDLLRRDGIE